MCAKMVILTLFLNKGWWENNGQHHAVEKAQMVKADSPETNPNSPTDWLCGLCKTPMLTRLCFLNRVNEIT